ncbi:dihydrolipoamide acetyltransferase family protein [Hufsiella ginkgonis]|uniref:Dihydrolipoamide acetyltransferase component of pyruvate dehydrogenase complex n=1 Tax=Hufsiella ginkgonis TaxID=2695274 RepID=A0A7K1XYG7_9SPHI|nr:dihydrolipoamide acetyltransferase family protein [Hufsiella ginkgonis]MXV15993.1 2-oxo acid dehydrogenase subunit E2 [Hufsiella ginkgonis]
MAQIELLLPKMGESVAEATVIKWLKKPGDMISEDEAVLEIATDKVDSEVPSPVSGRLISQLYKEEEVVQVGDVIALIETAAAAATPAGGDTVGENAPAVEPVEPGIPLEDIFPGMDMLSQAQPEPGKRETTAAAPATVSGRFYSPLVKSIAAEEGISPEELEKITGSGSEGRLTKEDLLGYVKNRKPGAETAGPGALNEASKAEEPAPAPSKEAEALKTGVNKPSAGSQQPPPATGNIEIIEMDRMRRLISDHMVMSKQTSPHVTSFVEADVTNIVKWRDRVKNSFEKREGQKITFTPIFIEAVAKAIRDMPMINVSVDGTKIIRKRDINIGMATALPSGNLIVPVIRNADFLSLVGLTKTVNDLANRARNNKLQPDEVKDGTFTITNVGTFGNVMGTPIINQPQVAILAIGVIKKKPAVIETPDGDMIAIRHMTYLSLSYDHRVVDGALGGSFLRRIADYLEGWNAGREF